MSAIVSAAPEASARPAQRRAHLTRDNRAGLGMSAPALIGLVAFVAVPFVAAIVLSTFNVHLNSPNPPQFWGLKQYARLFTDPDVSATFYRSLLNNFIFAFVVIPVQTGLALVLAVLLNRKLRGVAFFRTFFFMPVVFPMALVTVIWRLILDRSDAGLLNSLLHFLTGGNVGAHDWLGSSATAMGSVILLSVWQGVGFQMVILLAALQEIPEERYEAARLDRANAWQQFRFVTVPGIRNTLIFVVMYTTILAFRVYDQIYLMIRTGGGNQKSLQTLLYQATDAISSSNNLGRASAISVVLFVIVVLLTVVQRFVQRQERES